MHRIIIFIIFIELLSEIISLTRAEILKMARKINLYNINASSHIITLSNYSYNVIRLQASLAKLRSRSKSPQNHRQSVPLKFRSVSDA